MDFFAKTNDDLFDTVFETTRTSESLGGQSTMPRWQRKQEAMLKNKREPLSPRPESDNTPSKRSTKSASVTRTSSKASGSVTGDRFIANRSTTDASQAQWKLSKAADAEQSKAMDTPERNYAQSVANTLLGNQGDDNSEARVLGFKEKAPAAPAGYHDSIRVLYSKSRTEEPSKSAKAAAQPKRVIPTAAERVLDAPDFRDDYYLNLLDWNASNVIGIALNQKVFMWNATTQAISELHTISTGYVSSLKWMGGSSNIMAFGTSEAKVELWDIVKNKCLRVMDGHADNTRIGVLAWNRHMLTSGGSDNNIVNHDVRVRNHAVSEYRAHSQEVCGLTWNHDGEVLASGGNDNLVALWDARSTSTSSTMEVAPQFECREHISAVKALAWSPHQRNVLATGGGTADKCIKTWNSVNGQCLNTVNTGSQVTQLVWNPDAKELLSAHGYAENQLTLWSYPRMQKLADLTGHTSRILSVSMSPATGMICSAGGDETLRFWNPFGGRTRGQNAKGKAKPYYAPANSRAQYKTRLSIR